MTKPQRELWAYAAVSARARTASEINASLILVPLLLVCSLRLFCGWALLSTLSRPIPFTVRIALARELSKLSAAEITFTLKVINARWEIYPYKFIPGAGHARGRRPAFGLGTSRRPRRQGEDGERSQYRDHGITEPRYIGATLRVERHSFADSISASIMFDIYCFAPPASRSSHTGKSRFESMLECRRSLGAFDHDKIVVLPLEAGRGKVRGAGAQQSPIGLVAFEVHRCGGRVLGAENAVSVIFPPNWYGALCIALQCGAKFGGTLQRPFFCFALGRCGFRVNVIHHCQHFSNCLYLAIPA